MTCSSVALKIQQHILVLPVLKESLIESLMELSRVRTGTVTILSTMKVCSLQTNGSKRVFTSTHDASTFKLARR